eukprot:scaffold2.g6997.t1
MREHLGRQAPFVVVALLLLLSSSAHGYATQFRQTLQPNTCSAQPLDFGTSFFDYYLVVTAFNTTSCDASLVRVSDLFVSGVCIASRNNEQGGCSGGGPTVPYPSDSATTNLQQSSEACSQAAQTAPGDAWYSMDNLRLSKAYDQASLCANSNYGQIYFQNACNVSADMVVVLTYYPYTYCYNSSSGGWWEILLIFIACLSLLAIGFALFKRHRRRKAQQAQLNAVQMSHQAAPGGAAVPSNAEPGPYAYPPPGAWGAQQAGPTPVGQAYGPSPAAAVYGYPAGGYPPYPGQQPPYTTYGQGEFPPAPPATTSDYPRPPPPTAGAAASGAAAAGAAAAPTPAGPAPGQSPHRV